jgi:hypothetical protein
MIPPVRGGGETAGQEGNVSLEASDWRGRNPGRLHIYLIGAALAAWPAAFLRDAGPYENQVEGRPSKGEGVTCLRDLANPD